MTRSKKLGILTLADARRIAAEGQHVEIAVPIAARVSTTVLLDHKELARLTKAKGGTEREQVLDDLIAANVKWEPALTELTAGRAWDIGDITVSTRGVLTIYDRFDEDDDEDPVSAGTAS